MRNVNVFVVLYRWSERHDEAAAGTQSQCQRTRFWTVDTTSCCRHLWTPPAVPATHRAVRHIYIYSCYCQSFLTHADHVFLGLLRSLVPGSSNRVMELMHEVARCMCPYHLRHRVRRTATISSRSSFWWSAAEGISSASFAPQIHLIMVRSFLRSRCRSEAFGAQVSLPWSIVYRTQAVNTLPRYAVKTKLSINQSV